MENTERCFSYEEHLFYSDHRDYSIIRKKSVICTEDFTWDFNVAARDHVMKLSMDHTFIQRPGTHNFVFWLCPEKITWKTDNKKLAI